MREHMHGLQFLHCLENSTVGGATRLTDGFQLAETLRKEDPSAFKTLSTEPLLFANRAEDSDYRWEAPLISLDAKGALQELRFSPWLRGPLSTDLKTTDRIYRALRALFRRAEAPGFLRFTHRGGLLALTTPACFTDGKPSMGISARAGSKAATGPGRNYTPVAHAEPTAPPIPLVQGPRRQSLAGAPGGISRGEHRGHGSGEACQKKVPGLGIGWKAGSRYPPEGEGKKLLRKHKEGTGVFRKAVAKGRAQGTPPPAWPPEPGISGQRAVGSPPGS